MVAQYVGSSHASLLCNGTVTLFAALAALDIGAGDEVIVPDYSMIATANAVVWAGACPVFVDISAENLCLDLDLAERAITGRTKAIMLVSINGRSPDMQRAQDIATRHGIALVEDAAQSLGARWHGKHLGTFGVIGSFSFSAPKIITTGQGGALVTDRDDMAERITRIRDFGRPSAGVDFHECLGYNFKFTDLQAVVGIEQMKKLDRRVQRKKQMFALYQELLANVDPVQFLPTNLSDVPPWFIDILVPDPIALKAWLQEKGIGTRLFYPPIHSQPVYGQGGRFPKAQHVAAHGLWLPSSSFLEDDVIDHVCDRIREYYAHT